MKYMATASPSLARERQQAPSRKHAPTPKCESPFWATGSAVAEAKSLLGFMKHARATREQIISLISVSDAEYQSLCTWVGDKPVIAARLNDVMEFRDRTLKAFLVLVELEETKCKERTSR
jgi:hypothetical protein